MIRFDFPAYWSSNQSSSGKKLAESIIKERLAACVNRVSGVESVYHWQGEDPMRGGKDDMVEELVSRIHGDDGEALEKDVVAPPRRMVPEFMLKLARAVSPF